MSEQVTKTVQRLIKSGDAAAADLIDALRAENARLESLISGARSVTAAVIDERDQLRAELEALRSQHAERQEDQVMGRVHHNPDHAEPVRAVLNSIGRQLPDHAPLYASPPPAQDVSGLVELVGLKTFHHQMGAIVLQFFNSQQAQNAMDELKALAAYRKEPGK